MEEPFLPERFNNKEATGPTTEPGLQSSEITKTLTSPEKEFVIHTPLYSARVSNFGGGSFSSYDLKDYYGAWTENDTYVDSLGVTLLFNNGSGCAPCVGFQHRELREFFTCNSTQSVDINGGVSLEENESIDIVCSFETEDGVRVVKTTSFNGSSFVVSHHVRAFSGTMSVGEETDISFSLMWDSGINNTEKNLFDDISYSGVSVSHNEEITTLSFTPGALDDKLEDAGSYVGSIDWVAIRNKYFILAMIPEGPVGQAILGGRSQQLTSSVVSPVYEVSLVGDSSSDNLLVNSYFGPLDIDNINQLETTLDRIMNFGWFIIQPFSRGILWLLKFFHSFGINYGIILILFAFLVRLITGPLTKKSFESTQKMQAIQPELKKLQEKHKKNSQKLNTEMVKMYKEKGVNPLGGCFPMLLQMPLLFSLFMVFRSTIEFRGAPFFWWIKDLSMPDTVFNLPFYVPVYGDQVAFLPILLGISMFLTQKMTMANMQGGPGQQKYMMYFMSVFFFLLFNSFPSGLNLYYLVYNILNYLQQKSLKKT